MTASVRESQGESDTGTETSGIDFSLVRGDVGYRLQRRLGLIPASGMGIARRAIIFAAVTWVPLVLWALLTDRMWGTDREESFLSRYGVHTRCLIAIPLLVIAEGVAHQVVPRILGHFVESGLVRTTDLPQFRQLIANITRLKDRVLPWIVIFGVVVSWATVETVRQSYIDLSGPLAPAKAEDVMSMSFGGWWLVLVVRPLFAVLLFAWLWRAILVFILFVRLAKFPLAFVPIHPDRVGGLGFVERLLVIFSPVAFAISAAVAASFAHGVVYHGVNVMDIKGELIVAAVLIPALFLVPFLPMITLLGRLKRKATLDYGSIVAHHGRLVHRRWILGEDIGAPDILDAPELGPVADVQTMFQAVQQMRVLPVSKRGLLLIVAPAVLPLLLVTLLQFPIKAIVGEVLKTLL